MSVVTNQINDISSQVQSLLAQIYSSDTAKLAEIGQTMNLIKNIIPPNQIGKYTDQIEQMINIIKSNQSASIEAMQLLPSIKNIIVDLYDYLERIKTNVLTPSNRLFVKNNIDMIVMATIIAAMVSTQDFNLINQTTMMNVLDIIKVLVSLNIDMDVKNCIVGCYKKSTSKKVNTKNAKNLK